MPISFEEYLVVWKRWYKCAGMALSQESMHLSTIALAIRQGTAVPKESLDWLLFYTERYNRKYTPFCPGTNGYALTDGRWV